MRSPVTALAASSRSDIWRRRGRHSTTLRFGYSTMRLERWSNRRRPSTSGSPGFWRYQGTPFQALSPEVTPHDIVGTRGERHAARTRFVHLAGCSSSTCFSPLPLPIRPHQPSTKHFTDASAVLAAAARALARFCRGERVKSLTFRNLGRVAPTSIQEFCENDVTRPPPRDNE